MPVKTIFAVLLTLAAVPSAHTCPATRLVRLRFDPSCRVLQPASLAVTIDKSHVTLDARGDGDVNHPITPSATLDLPEVPGGPALCFTTRYVKDSDVSPCVIEFTVTCNARKPWTVIAATDERDVTLELAADEQVQTCGGQKREARADLAKTARALPNRITVDSSDTVNVRVQRLGTPVMSFAVSVKNEILSVRVLTVTKTDTSTSGKDERLAQNDFGVDKNKRRAKGQ